ncbi:MAG: cytochrome b5 domain-containing protein [Candidatus Taylorbacteria bacterium]|nr:cytochrome b5 domain-containing protein [Candidatus Taylorbacteria bacterium]
MDMTKNTIILIVLVSLAYGGYSILASSTERESVESNLNIVPSTSTDAEENIISNIPDERFGADGQEDPVTGPTKFTMADIATHNNASSCYTAVRGTVYNLTNFIAKHPGGAANILKICGKDGTDAFQKRHEGRSGPEEELKSHEIGILVQ